MFTLYDIGVVNFLMNASYETIQSWYNIEYDKEYAMEMINIAINKNSKLIGEL